MSPVPFLPLKHLPTLIQCSNQELCFRRFGSGKQHLRSLGRRDLTTNLGSQVGFLMMCLLEETQTHLGSQRQPQIQTSSISISLNFGEFLLFCLCKAKFVQNSCWTSGNKGRNKLIEKEKEMLKVFSYPRYSVLCTCLPRMILGIPGFPVSQKDVWCIEDKR